MKATTSSQVCEELERLDAGGADLALLLSRTVELLHEFSPLFDWTGIYELGGDGMLRLGPFVGESTEHVTISVGHGVCGSAVANNCNMNIPDVSKATNYLACSSATKSELVVLIRRDDWIYAQVDIDSHELDAFSEELVEEVQRLSDWLALAYEKHVGRTVGATQVAPA